MLSTTCLKLCTRHKPLIYSRHQILAIHTSTRFVTHSCPFLPYHDLRRHAQQPLEAAESDKNHSITSPRHRLLWRLAAPSPSVPLSNAASISSSLCAEVPAAGQGSVTVKVHSSSVPPGTGGLDGPTSVLSECLSYALAISFELRFPKSTACLPGMATLAACDVIGCCSKRVPPITIDLCLITTNSAARCMSCFILFHFHPGLVTASLMVLPSCVCCRDLFLPE